MAEHRVVEIVAACERYWRETGVPGPAVTEMTSELEQHLIDAVAAGRSADVVVGADLAAFAEAWADERRDRRGPQPSWDEVAAGATVRSKQARRAAIVTSLLSVGAILVALVAAPAADPATTAVWRWLWTLFALAMGIGEIFTAGFFLLPFAAGAGAAAVLAWLGVEVLAQWLVFFFVTGLALFYLRQFISHQDDDAGPAIGANRYVNATGVVIERIDPAALTGMVRVETEEWRATTDGTPIEVGARVVVSSIRGARLVVEEA